MIFFICMLRTRHPASEALVELRNALEKNQQQFAEVLGASKVTTARYETSHPPSGDTLLKLAKIADRHQRADIADRFRALHLEELFEHFGDRLIVILPKAYLMLRLRGVDEIDAAQCFMTLIDCLRASEPKRKAAGRKALAALQAVRNTRHPLANKMDAAQRRFFAKKETKQ